MTVCPQDSGIASSSFASRSSRWFQLHSEATPSQLKPNGLRREEADSDFARRFSAVAAKEGSPHAPSVAKKNEGAGNPSVFHE